MYIPNQEIILIKTKTTNKKQIMNINELWKMLNARKCRKNRRDGKVRKASKLVNFNPKQDLPIFCLNIFTLNILTLKE
jgi:hypothetical protein